MREQVPNGRPGRRLVLVWVAAAVLLLDQVSKLAVRNLMDVSRSIPILPGIFHLTHVRNSGAAFGMLADQRFFFFAITGAVIAFILVYYARARPTDLVLLTALGLELGGAVGNLIDRLTLGTVTDFLDFRFWPVFNVADSSIVVGVGLIGIVMIKNARRHAREREAA